MKARFSAGFRRLIGVMQWVIEATKDEASWLDDYVQDILAIDPPALPPHDQKVGHVETHWHQTEAGVAYVAANPDHGTPDDRVFAEQVVIAQLRPFGFKQAVYPAMYRNSGWASPKVMADAARLVQTGAVQLNTNSQNAVTATVQGDGTDNNGEPDTHQVEIHFQDPENPQAVTGLFCDCQWGQFMNTPRTRQFRRFQPNGKPTPCKHCIATYWVSRHVPTEEQRAPGDFGQEGQMQLPGMPSGGEAGSQMGLMQRSPWINPNAWFTQPGAPTQSPFAPPPPGGDSAAMPPSPEQVLPQFPMDPSLIPEANPASVPGGRPGPTPTNPLQYPGGTFSSVRVSQGFKNGDIVTVKQDTMGEYVGRPESGMPGTKVDIRKGQSGHVRGVDPSTGMVEVLFMGSQFENFGELMPFGATAWCWPSELQLVDPRAPGAPLKRLW